MELRCKIKAGWRQSPVKGVMDSFPRERSPECPGARRALPGVVLFITFTNLPLPAPKPLFP